MRLRFLGISLLSLLVFVTCAQADVVTSADVFLLSGPSAAQSGSFTSSSAVIDANNFANAVINPSAGTMGVQAVSGPSNRADASATHTDTWYCAIGGGCGTLPISVSLGIFLEGSASLGPTNDAHLEALYSIGTTEYFKFVFDQADGSFGATASYTDTGGTTDIPVTLTDNGNGTVAFSLNFLTTNAVFPSMCNAPCLTSTGDVQNLNAFTNGGSVDAFHTFGVTITSLDPNIQLISADGRTGGTGTAPVPEPGTLTLLGTGLAGLAVRFRFKRK
jgi:hypothetical protein